jgi:hypothetical protein
MSLTVVNPGLGPEIVDKGIKLDAKGRYEEGKSYPRPN